MSENVWLCVCVLVPEHEYAWFMRYEEFYRMTVCKSLKCPHDPERCVKEEHWKKNGSWNAKNVTSTSSEY